MRTSRTHRWVLAVAGLMLVVAACGTDSEVADGDTTVTEAPTNNTTDNTETTMDDGMVMDDGHEDGHDHGDHEHGAREWDGGTAPTVSLEVVADPSSGYNVIATVTDFMFAPENASGAHVAGEGHAHVLVDGEQIARVYGEAFHIGSLEPGMHEVSYGLASNSHDNYTVEGEPLRATVMVEVPDMMDDGHSHSHGGSDHIPWDGPETPSVTIEVVKDAKSGWNLLGDVTGFTVTPENASTDHVPGEGHMHIYVNGERLARVYTADYHIPALPAGDLEIELRLGSNDHREFMLDGEVVGGSTTITVSEEDGSKADDHHDGDGHDHDHGNGDDSMIDAEPDHVIMVSYEGGEVIGEARYEVSTGDVVEIHVIADVTDEVHVHGYDKFAEVAPGSMGMLRFIAEVPGIFEVELESSGDLLFELVVR